jgi:hypothetical protein
LYLKGTNWFTSVLPLMMRLSAALTRRALGVADVDAEEAGAEATEATGGIGAFAPSSKVRMATGACEVREVGGGGLSIRRLFKPLAKDGGVEVLTSSSQVNIDYFPIQ